MGATRLPGKILLKISGKTILEHVINRLRLSKCIDEIVVATTVSLADNAVADLCEKIKVNCFRGSEEDVLERYKKAADAYRADTVVRITSDCPLIDPHIIDQMIQFYQKNSYEMVSNANSLDFSLRSFPRGLDAEVFSHRVLNEAYEKGQEKYQREHVTPYMYEYLKNIFYFQSDVNYSHLRWTMDTPQDFKLIEEIYSSLYHGEHNFFLKDILDLFERRPDLYEINKEIHQKNTKS